MLGRGLGTIEGNDVGFPLGDDDGLDEPSIEGPELGD
jgi:hypothetical protein